MTPRISVQTEDIDPAAELARLNAAGAVATFIGHVRGDDGVVTLTLEAHPVMTHAALADLAADAAGRWPLEMLVLVHRIGALQAGERIVFVGTASAHRQAALDACAFLIDRLKTDVPLWKCETRADGSRRWVEQRENDLSRADQWRAG